MRPLTEIFDRERLKQLPKNHGFWAVIVLIAAVAAGLPPLWEARIWPDSGSYLGLSWARMPVYPLIASAIGPGYALVCFQFFLSLLLWSWLGWVVGRAWGVLVAACIALSGPILMWDLAVLSESVCLSLLVASLAATILLYRRWSRTRFVVWCAIVLLFTLTRTSNMFLVPFLAIPFVVTNRRQLLSVVLAALVIFVISDSYSRYAGGDLRKVSLVNVYTGRLMRNDNSRAFCVDHGMPMTPDMEQYVKKTGRKNMRALFRTSPEFERWFEKKGGATYYKWLFTQPVNYSAPWKSITMNLDFLNLQYAEGTRIRRTAMYLTLFYAKIFIDWRIWLVGLLLPLLCWRLRSRVSPSSLLVPALMVGIYAQAYVGLHGDRAEISRHMLVALVLYRITIILILVYAGQILWQWRRQRAATAQPKTAKAGGRARSGQKSKRKRR